MGFNLKKFFSKGVGNALTGGLGGALLGGGKFKDRLMSLGTGGMGGKGGILSGLLGGGSKPRPSVMPQPSGMPQPMASQNNMGPGMGTPQAPMGQGGGPLQTAIASAQGQIGPDGQPPTTGGFPIGGQNPMDPRYMGKVSSLARNYFGQ